MKKLKGFGAALAAIPLIFGLAACGGSDSASGSSSKDSSTVKIGIVSDEPAQAALKDLAAKDGIKIEYVSFSDYQQANPALKAGDIDMNWFQHLAFLADYNNNANDTLTPIGATEIVPLGLYSQKHKTLAEIPQGGEIAIPNDSINQARALLVLKSAGLVTFTRDTVAPSDLDVDKSKSKVKVTPVAAEQTVLSLQSVDGSVINNTFLSKANIDPKSALTKDNPSDPNAVPYINAFVVRDADKDNATYKKIAALYHDPSVWAKVKEESKGTSVEAKNDVAQLRDVLAKYEASLKAAK